ncbi:MAG: glycosyltransferase family 2 protein [Anaerolineae bacterium]|nr:glycosyltransferase family 2 protein [Anaerolineae bacterium]
MGAPAALVVTALSGLILFLLGRDILLARRLPKLTATTLSGDSPKVTIVIPARNEQANIEPCVRGALGQTYPNYSVVVVDDHSTDGTPHILRRLAETFGERLRVVLGRPLPPGWVGKCNACWHGAQHADLSEWLLFLDADTVPQPGLLAALIAFAQSHRLDVLSVLPFNELPTLAEQLVLPVFYQFALTAFPLRANLSPEAPAQAVIANGQCLLVRASAYWSIGGHEAVKDKVLEDIELAQALRRAGFRVGLATAFDFLRVRMYRSFGEIVQGLGKHAAAGRWASGWRAFWAVARMTLTTALPPVLLLLASAHAASAPSLVSLTALATALSAYAVHLGFWVQRYRLWYRLPARAATQVALGWLLYLYIVVRGTLRVWLGRGVVWKERVYS